MTRKKSIWGKRNPHGRKQRARTEYGMLQLRRYSEQVNYLYFL